MPKLFSRGSNFVLSNLSDYENVLSRLEKIPTLVQRTREALDFGIARGLTYSKESMEGVEEQFQLVLKNNRYKVVITFGYCTITVVLCSILLLVVKA